MSRHIRRRYRNSSMRRLAVRSYRHVRARRRRLGRIMRRYH